MTGFVYIIGAGCGSADLITVRGLNALKRCDTVVYDALIDQERAMEERDAYIEENASE